MKTEVEILETKLEEQAKVILELQQQVKNNIWYDSADIKVLYNISESTLIRYRKEKKIPFTKLGGRFLYPKAFFTKSLMEKLENKHLL